MPPTTPIYKYALANALLTAFYVMLVGIFMHAGPVIFGHDGDSALIPMTLLLIFVFSALITGSLVLGRPILWYIDGRKKDALKLFVYTTAILFVVVILMLLVSYLVNRV